MLAKPPAAIAFLLALSVTAGSRAAPEPAGRAAGVARVEGGGERPHARPHALAVDARGDVLYAALSTADRLAVFDVRGGRSRRLPDLIVGRFPDALAPLPGGGVVVASRFDPALRVVARRDAGGGDGARVAAPPAFDVRSVDGGPEHGHRGIAVDGAGRFAYVASPPRGGVEIVDLAAAGGAVRFMATGVFPQGVRWVPAASSPSRRQPLLLVSNFIGHTVTIHEVADDGSPGPASQTVATEAPVLDFAIVPPGMAGDLAGSLLLLTHEDRVLSRAQLSVEGLDSVALILRPSSARFPLPAPVAPTSPRFAGRGETPSSSPLFFDPGSGRREALNLGERAGGAVIELESLALDPISGRVAIAGAGSDNLLIAGARLDALASTPAITVGSNPSAVAFLPGGRVVTADRLSDTLSFVQTRAVSTVEVGTPGRPTPAERGELLFFSRALVPHNVATGPLSLYTCAACHADGAIDGRRHPSKRNRFYSMTKSCRGLRGTEPFLSLGEPATFDAFADNIVGTHAQGALAAPDTYDRYSVRLRLRAGGRWREATLSPADLRAALSAYMARIPVEPSPFVEPGRVALSAVERRGLDVFRGNCAGCHRLARATADGAPVPPADLEAALLEGQVALTSRGLHDVGTPVLGRVGDASGNNPPSLHGVWAAGPYFSDGSAATLNDVVRRTNPGADKVHAPSNTSPFSAEDQASLVAFLRAL